MFIRLQNLERERKKILENGKEVTVEYELKMVVHNGSGFDMIKTGKSTDSLKNFNGNVNIKTIPNVNLNILHLYAVIHLYHLR